MGRYYLDQPTLLEYFLGNIKQMGHIPKIVEECPNNMTLKDFHYKLITRYHPCLFIG